MEAPRRHVQTWACLICRHAQRWHSVQPRRLSSLSKTPQSACAHFIRPISQHVRTLASASVRRRANRDANRETTPLGVDSSESLYSSSEESLLAARRSAEIVLANEAVPSNEQVLEALDAIEQAGRYLVDSNSLSRPQPVERDENATSALLSLAAKHASKSEPRETKPESAPVRKMIDSLSLLAYEIAVHPPVFLSPQVLAKYVDVQVLLLRLDTLPEIFDWYAHKPTPIASKKDVEDVTYEQPSAKAIAAAVDDKVANRALDAAIHTRDLALALSIVETTFRAPSYKRAKIFKKAVPPMGAAALAPVAAWSLASQMATIQTGLSEESFTTIAFAGMSTYVLAVGTIGYVALTTANDQMQRVTWAVGMPLRTRWLREEERAALDRVAMAWGFREKSKWGEEEGEEWDELKEWLGVRGMVLDKVGLMDGME